MRYAAGFGRLLVPLDSVLWLSRRGSDRSQVRDMEGSYRSIEAIRKRPGMYVGDLEDDTGLHQLLWEVLSRAVDEHLDGGCKRIGIILCDGSVTVEDDGRGISVEPLPDGTPLLLHQLMHVNFPPRPGQIRLGLTNVCLVVVSGLSRRMLVETTCAGRRHRIEFVRGMAGPLVELGPAVQPGTTVTYEPDPEIFSQLEYDKTMICKRLTEIAAICPGLDLHCIDQRSSRITCPGGLPGLLLRQRPTSSKTPRVPLLATAERDGVRVAIALAWVVGSRGTGHVRSCVNLHDTPDGGTHVSGLLRALNVLLPENLIRREATRRALRQRIEAIVSVLHPAPSLHGPTLSKLLNPEVKPLVEHAVRDRLAVWNEEHPEEVGQLLLECVTGKHGGS